MNYLRKMHMLCINRAEFEAMYKEDQMRLVLIALKERGWTLEELSKDKDQTRMFGIVDSINSIQLKKKENVELFVSLFGHLGMYPDGSEVCFILKDSIDPRKTPITTLEVLKSSIKEDSGTDFAISSKGELRQFQLKQYKGKLSTDDLFSFIKKKIEHYGTGLEQVNLLILLQTADGNIGDINFEDLTKRIHKIGIRSDCEILVLYNEENKFDVINTVYPTLATCRKERATYFKWHSEGR